MSKKPTTPTFEDREIDASIDRLCWLVLCPFTCGAVPYRTTLTLDREEVTKTDVSICGQTVSKRPYGELGSVDKSTCLCCVNVTSSFGEISPGCGCSQVKVDDIVEELKSRQKGRGDTAQIQRTEQTLERLDDLEAKIDLILDHLKIPKPMQMEERK